MVADTVGRYHVKKIVQGSRIADMLAFARYDAPQAWENFRRMLAARVAAGHFDAARAEQFAKQYEAGLTGTTYLE